MSAIIEAIYEEGCLRLSAPLPLPEHTRVSVSVEPLPVHGDRGEWLAQGERRLREVWDNDADDVYNELLVP